MLDGELEIAAGSHVQIQLPFLNAPVGGTVAGFKDGNTRLIFDLSPDDNDEVVKFIIDYHQSRAA